MSSSEKKSLFLGMSLGKARNRLVKSIILMFARKCGEDKCFKCGEPILSEKELTIEHKLPWEGIDTELYWDLENVALSHAKCNRPHRPSFGQRKEGPPGTAWCITHQEFLPIDRFYIQRNGRWNGRKTRCIACRKKYDRRVNHARKINGAVEEGLTHFPVTEETAGSNPVSSANGGHGRMA